MREGEMLAARTMLDLGTNAANEWRDVSPKSRQKSGAEVTAAGGSRFSFGPAPGTIR